MVRFWNTGRSRPAWLQRVLDALRPHKTLIAVGVGFAIQWSAVHLTIARPMHDNMSRMQAQLDVSHKQMESLAALRGSANQAHDLLSALKAQQESLVTAEQALADIRALRLNLEQEARKTRLAEGHLVQLGRLQTELASIGQETAALADVLRQVNDLNDELAALKQPTEVGLANVAMAEQVLTQLDGLHARIDKEAASLPAAEKALADSLNLQTKLAESAESSESAQAQVDRLISLARGLNAVDGKSVASADAVATDLLAIHDMLSDAEGLRLKQAEHNLQTLMATHSDLLRATPTIAAAAENLELLTEFQTELTRQIDGLESLRKELTEVALLRETVSRVTEAIRPLAEMSDLRRLDADQVRAMAREILERRTAQAEFNSVYPVGPSEVVGPSSPIPPAGLDLPVPEPMDP